MTDNITAFIAGPSNNGKKNLYTFGHINEMEYTKYIDNIAKIINENIDKIGLLPDIGVPLDVAKAIYKLDKRNTKIIGYYPRYGNTQIIKDNLLICDQYVEINGGWAEMNTQPSKNFDIMICIGLSAGVFTEIAHTKVHKLWSNKDIPILIDERTISSHINIELESDVNLVYFNNDESFVKFIKKIKGGKVHVDV